MKVVFLQKEILVAANAFKHIGDAFTQIFIDELNESNQETEGIEVSAGSLESLNCNPLWPTVFDTRISSQVICNKPRNLVKKII